MNKRRIYAAIVAFVMMVGVTALWSAETTKRDGDEDANVISDSGAKTGKSDTDKKGNRLVRAFKAPFKAIGRLFGGGKDDNKLQRMTEKDAEKFESAGVAKVEDARTDKTKPKANGNSARDHLAVGRALLESGRVNDAIEELSLAVSLDAKLKEAQNLLGVAYDQKGLHERAKDSYERAIKDGEEDAQTLNNLGFSLYQNGNYRAALDRLKRAAKLAPNDERILNNLALAQARLGKFDDAYKNFKRAGGELTGRLNTATLLERMGRDDEAIKYYEQALHLQPNSSIALRRLADLYNRVGKYEQARAMTRSLNSLGSEMAVGN